MATITTHVAPGGIGRSLADFQAELERGGSSFGAHLQGVYADRWTSTAMHAALALRTELVVALHDFLAARGLLNIDRVSLAPVTDPLAHGVEHVPVIPYKGVPYRTTHSMIYAKMLACMNPALPGVFVDSPNIRLELASADGSQRGKYLVDFSQMDIELRRKGRIGADMYFDEPETVSRILSLERDRALDLLEDMVVHATRRIAERRQEELSALGVRLEVPSKPFPRFDRDEALARHAASGEAGLERALGREAGGQFFWILGILRENYDLVYPYLGRDGYARPRAGIASHEVYNYDLCAASRGADGALGDAYEVLSGGLREWLPEAITARLLANGIISARPRFGEDGEILNMEELEGYGPFIAASRLRDHAGLPLYPETAGGGLGIERCLFALLRGPVIRRIEDLTLFGKNPDSGSLYLF